LKFSRSINISPGSLPKGILLRRGKKIPIKIRIEPKTINKTLSSFLNIYEKMNFEKAKIKKFKN